MAAHLLDSLRYCSTKSHREISRVSLSMNASAVESTNKKARAFISRRISDELMPAKDVARVLPLTERPGDSAFRIRSAESLLLGP